LKRIINLYRNAFAGLSRPAWMLALVMLINRSGTMVVPFLSVYLTDALGYSVKQAGLIISFFGIGSIIGSYLGGNLSDRYGHFIIQILALVLSGLLFFVLSGVREYYMLIIGITVLSIVAESFRPANAASVSFYAKPENVSRAFSLNRMAINLGFSIGPALGGFLAAISYRLIFMVDGATCILAGIIFYIYFKNRKGHTPLKVEDDSPPKLKSAYSDKKFILFSVLSTIFAILFFQLFMTLPLYYKEVYDLNESRIGSILAMNGIIVFSLEMIMVYILQRKFSLSNLIFTGMLLLGASFVILNFYHHVSMLILAMFLLSLSEIFVMPFMVTYVVQHSTEENRGSYMGLYTISYSLAFVLSPILGAFVIDGYGFDMLWWLTGIISVFLGIAFLILIGRK
jgi:predicted MFS family arabinose efflux permease